MSTGGVLSRGMMLCVTLTHWIVLILTELQTLLLSGTISQGGQDKDVELRVPLLFTSFLDRAKNKLWTHLFENGVIFDASRKNEDNSTLFIDSLTPISDIFYLLQTLAPGMLLIVRMDEIACAREIETARALPSADWVRDHEAILRYVFGSEERYKSLVAAAADVSKSFRTETSGYSSNDGGEDDGGRYYTDLWGMDDPLDYLDCGPECGYCGHCAF